MNTEPEYTEEDLKAAYEQGRLDADNQERIRAAQARLDRLATLAVTDSHGDYDELCDSAAEDLCETREYALRSKLSGDALAERRHFYGA